MLKDDFKIINTETTHIGRFDIVYDTIEKAGQQYPYSYVKMKRGVGVLAFCNEKVILLKQYRYIWHRWFWEIPGGMVEDDEQPAAAAKREVEEETGFKVIKIEPLGVCYPSIGSTTEIQYLFAAQCEEKDNQCLDALEKINVQVVEMDTFEKMIKENEFCHGMGLAAWARLKQ